MVIKRRQFTKDFQQQVIREIEAGKTLAQAAREHQLHQQYAQKAFAGNGKTYTDEARIAALERKSGQITMENDLLKKALLRLEAFARSHKGNGSK